VACPEPSAAKVPTEEERVKAAPTKAQTLDTCGKCAKFLGERISRTIASQLDII